jgi:uncharacterized protein
LTRSPSEEDSVFVVHVGKGQEVLETIAAAVDERGVTAAALTLIGAVGSCRVSVMPKDDPADDILTEYAQPFELTGSGEVVDGKPHVHVSLGGDGEVVAGHLHWARVDHWFVRAYVQPL